MKLTGKPIAETLLRAVKTPRDWYFITLGAAMGVVTAFGAVGFKWLLDTTAEGGFLIHAQLGWWTLIALPMLGALGTALLIKVVAPEAKGHGVPEVMLATHIRGGVIRPRVALAKAIASISTIGSGGSAGAEGPIVQIGASLGSAMARLLRIERDQVPTLLGCGAAAGIASVFNAPIAGVFFVMEILLKDFTVRTFTPIMIASVLSVATTHAILGKNEAIFAVSEELRGYQFAIAELPSYLVLGLVCGVVAVGFIKILYATEDFFDAPKILGLPVPSIARPVIGAALLGILGLAYLAVLQAAGQSAAIPNFFGNGYETIRALLEPATFNPAELQPRPTAGSLAPHHPEPHFHAPTTVWLLLVLVAAKALATAFTLGSGGSGGVFAPSLFLGAGVGAAVGLSLEAIGLVPVGGSPAAYALVGMAAVVAATTHAPLTAILVLFELTSDYKVILPIMLAAVVATSIARLIVPDSIYTLKLRRRGVNVGSAIDHTLLRRLRARDIAPVPHVTVRPSDPLGKLLELRDAYRIVDFVVLDSANRYSGMVTGQDLRTALIEREAIPYLLVAELVRQDLPVIVPDETLDSVLKKFSDADVSSLALVESTPDGRAGDKVLGLITRGRLMRRYNEALNSD